MDLLNQIKLQLSKMSEAEKDGWILSQARQCPEEKRNDFLLSLSGEKKVMDMPTQKEIDQFCQRAEQGEIYFEYETHYCEFSSEGRYIDDWAVRYNDPLDAIPFLNRIFSGCHDLMCLEEYQMAADILSRVCELRFPVEEAEDSEDSPPEEFFTLTDAEKEGMLVPCLEDVGTDWIKAAARLTEGQEGEEQAKKLIELFEHPVCLKIKPRILKEEGVSQKTFSHMVSILDEKIMDLEELLKNKFGKREYFREGYRLSKKIDREKELLLDIQMKCLNTRPIDTPETGSSLKDSWKQIKKNIEWLSYERYIDDQMEIEEINDICEALIKEGHVEQENWELRKKILKQIVLNEYYDHYSCGDAMEELAEHLCTNQTEYLAYADIMDTVEEFREKAACLYYKYGREDKYVSYMEKHLDRRSKEYTALIAYYQEHDNQEDACRVAQLGLEQCKEDLTDMFLCLLSDAQKKNDQKGFQKLYASAKRRKRVDIEKLEQALGDT